MPRKPIEYIGIPKFGILRLKYPVHLVRANDQLRRHVLQLQCRIQLKALIDRYAVIELTGRDQCRGIKVICELVRRPTLVHGGVLPRHSLELPINEPDLFGRRRH